MVNLLKSELLKLKKDTMFWVGTLIVILIPILILWKDCFIAVPPSVLTEWILSICMIDFLSLCIISGFIITNLMQQEYRERTIINVMTSSITRLSFLLTKMVVWFVWYMAMVLIMAGLALLGSYLLYLSQLNASQIKFIVIIFTKFGLFSFLAFIPLLWITILQRNRFYPSLLFTMGFTIILIGGANITPQMLLPASLFPWTAVSVITFLGMQNPYFYLGIAMIVFCGIFGLILTYLTFSKQDL